MAVTRREISQWVAEWVAAEGKIRPGILGAVTSGLAESLAIMDGSPGRYTFCEREDTREALAYLRSRDWTVPQTTLPPIS